MFVPLFGPIPGGMEIMVLLLLVVVGAPLAYLMSSDEPAARKAGQMAGPGKESASKPSNEEVLRQKSGRTESTVEQNAGSGLEIPQEERYRLQQVARRSIPATMLLSLIAPLGYLIVKKPWWALISALFLNFGGIGGIFVMFHTRKTIKDARRELAAAGYEW
jgi:hypothetical protein